jgi:hypothetical protein
VDALISLLVHYNEGLPYFCIWYYINLYTIIEGYISYTCWACWVLLIFRCVHVPSPCMLPGSFIYTGQCCIKNNAGYARCTGWHLWIQTLWYIVWHFVKKKVVGSAEICYNPKDSNHWYVGGNLKYYQQFVPCKDMLSWGCGRWHIIVLLLHCC